MDYNDKVDYNDKITGICLLLILLSVMLNFKNLVGHGAQIFG